MKSIIAGLLVCLSCAGAFASSYSVYTQPNKHSQRIGVINDQSHIIPIYRQGDWVEVGSQQTGQTGWVNTQGLMNQKDMRQARMNEIKLQRQRLLQARDRFMREFNQAMHQLDQQAQAMLHQQSVAMMPLTPAMQTALPSGQTYGTLSTKVTLQCQDGKGVKTVKAFWVDKNGEQHTKQYSKNIAC